MGINQSISETLNFASSKSLLIWVEIFLTIYVYKAALIEKRYGIQAV